jgi:hypothetical protein
MIDAIFTGADSMRYARLVSVSDPTVQKTLSLDVLMDPKRYFLNPPSVASNR